MFSKSIQIATMVALSAVFSLTNSTQAASAESYSYIAWVQTQSVIYMTNQNYETDDPRWGWAFEANVAARDAFLEILAFNDNERGSSLLVARDDLDEASINLYWMTQEVLPRNLRDQVRSAQRYISLARSRIQKQIDN